MEFRLSALITIGTFTVVEADTLEQAVEIAKRRQPISVMPNSGETENDSWMIDEIDGEPYDIHED